MQPEALTIVVRGIGMVLLIAGGLASLLCGFHVYQRGVGPKRDLAAFELGPVKLKANSVGSVVMATAAIWAWLGVSICPSIEKSANGIRVYSLQTSSNNQVKVPSFETSAWLDPSMAKTDPNQLESLFRDAVARQSWCQDNPVALDGKPARVDPNSIIAEGVGSGGYVLSARVRAGSSWVQLAFEPSITCGKVAFVPKRVEETRQDDHIPNEN